MREMRAAQLYYSGVRSFVSFSLCRYCSPVSYFIGSKMGSVFSVCICYVFDVLILVFFLYGIFKLWCQVFSYFLSILSSFFFFFSYTGFGGLRAVSVIDFFCNLLTFLRRAQQSNTLVYSILSPLFYIRLSFLAALTFVQSLVVG